MDELKSSGKPFEISKQEVWDAWIKVKGNKGAPGVDGQSIEAFETDLKNNLYKIWNRMSSGTYFPPPVMAVEIPKPMAAGPGFSGCPLSRTGSRRPWRRPGWRPRWNRSSTRTPTGTGRDAALWTRWRHAGSAAGRTDWVIDLDVPKFFDSVPWDLIVKAVRGQHSPPARWVVLYVQRWLAAPLQQSGRHPGGAGPGNPAGFSGFTRAG